MLYSFEIGGIPYLLCLNFNPVNCEITIKTTDESFRQGIHLHSGFDIVLLATTLFQELGSGFSTEEVELKRKLFLFWAKGVIVKCHYKGSSEKLQQFENDGISTL